MSDSFRDVIDGLNEGRESAVAEMAARYTKRLIGLARARLDDRIKNKVGASDIVQSVLNSFFERQRAADGSFEFENWDGLWALLATITARKCGRQLKYWTAAKRDVRLETPAQPAGSDSSGVSPEFELPDHRDADAFSELLDELFKDMPERHQRILELRLSGCTVGEIARDIGCTERTVFRVLDAARGTLKQVIQEG